MTKDVTVAARRPAYVLINVSLNGSGFEKTDEYEQLVNLIPPPLDEFIVVLLDFLITCFPRITIFRDCIFAWSAKKLMLRLFFVRLKCIPGLERE